MSQSHAKVALHLVFSTKQRKTWLKDSELRRELYAYMATVLANEVDSQSMIINGTEDHVHVLCWLSRRFPVMKLIEMSKKETSKWLKKQHHELAAFSWQSGYGAFSVSVSNIPEVKRYIADQEKHHRRISFQDEFRLLCEKHGADLDERYVWD